jgi:hypothetical protein
MSRSRADQATELMQNINLLYDLLCEGSSYPEGEYPGDDYVPSLEDEMLFMERFPAFVASLPPGARLYFDSVMAKIHCDAHDLLHPLLLQH